MDLGEHRAIREALSQAGGNISDAAKRLGSSRRTLQKRMRAYGMPRGRSGRRKRHLPYGRRNHELAIGGVVVGVIGLLAARRYLRK